MEDIQTIRVEDRDSLTVLPNRRAVERNLGHAVGTIPGNFALLEMDVDGLKLINDKYGHDEGDAFIRNIAEILDQLVRTGELYPAHKSGDEFSILLYGVSDDSRVAAIKERIRAQLDEYGIEVSMGGRVHQTDESAEDLAKAADRLLYEDKIRRKLEKHDPVARHQIAQKIASVALGHGISLNETREILWLMEQGYY